MTYYSDDLIEEVISQNDIVEVISEYVTLKKRGRNFIGLCPFHREKTPSFTVSQDKQIFKCFGCSEGGNVISFIMKIENLEFFDSVELLANRAHIDLSKYMTKSSFKKGENQNINIDRKETLYNLNKEAAKYFHDMLNEELLKTSSVVKEYVKKRKLDSNILTKFGIGFSNEKIPLYDYLIQKGYSKEDIIYSGIIVETEKGRLYNRFSNRLIFPIFDIRDRVIGFGGRVLDDSLPKYVNSPENEIYSKGRHLYSLNFAKKQKTDSVIIVEGYMDAISLHKNGFSNVVASLGTALTENQARLLKKYTDLVIIGYDQDSAGQDATLRGLDILSDKGLNVKVLKLDREDVKDPDEYINKYGEERFKKCINNSISLVEFKISKYENELKNDDITSKINFLNKSANILAKIENNIERDVYITTVADKYKISRAAIINEIDKILKKNQEKFDFKVNIEDINKKMHMGTNVKKRQEQYIIALILSKDKKIQEKIFSDIKPEYIDDENVRKVYVTLIELMKNYDINKIDIISKIKDNNVTKEITDIMYLDVSDKKEKLLNDIIKAKKKNGLLIRRQQILARISENISKDEQEVLQFELNQIILELSKLK